MSIQDYSEVLATGSIWQTRKRGSLNIVLYVTNIDLSAEAQKIHKPQVVFSDGKHILSTTIDRFISRREYLRTDEDVANMLYDAIAMPITSKPQAPSFLLDEDEDVDDETGIYVGEDEDNYEGPQNFTYDDYYPQTPASIEAHEQEEVEQETEALEHEEQPIQEASVSITANAHEEPIYHEECPVKLVINGQDTVDSIISYSQSVVEQGIVHEVRFSAKDSITQLLADTSTDYELTLGNTTLDFTAEDILSAYAGYDHGQVFYSIIFIERYEDDNQDEATENEDANLVIDSEKPIELEGTVNDNEDVQPSEDEEEVQSLDLFEDMPEDQETVADLEEMQDEVQAQEDHQEIEEIQEESEETIEESPLEQLAEENQTIEDTAILEYYEDSEKPDIASIVPMSYADQDLMPNETGKELSDDEPELPENSDSAIFVYNKQIEENNALADRLEAAINQEGEEDNGSNNPNTAITEERSA